MAKQVVTNDMLGLPPALPTRPKRRARKPKQAQATGEKPTMLMPAALAQRVTALKQPVLQAADRFAVVRESLRTLAPRVMAVYNAIVAHDASFSFVQFAQAIDPSVPTHAQDRNNVAGYRNHRTYYTLAYMRRLVQLRPRGRQGVRDSATDALARSIATILQIVAEPITVWQAVQAEFGFGERAMTGLRKRVEATQPLFVLELPSRKPATVGRVIHMAACHGRTCDPHGARAGGRCSRG